MPTPAVTQGYVDRHDVSLKEYFDMRLEQMDKALDARFIAQEKAIDTASEASERRLNAMNEFRASLEDQSKTYATLAEFVAFKAMIKLELDQIRSSVDSLNLTRAELAGKASQSQVTIATIISVAGLLLSVIGIILSIRG